MFYSHELLGRKSPLGAVWIAAHGKKLNRSKVMNVNVVQTCEQLINPEIPQALRLQGILIGGIVIVFNRQQTYLLDDCNDTLRKVRAVTVDQPAGNTVLEKGKQQARPDAITVPDLDEFFGGRLNLALMNPFAASVHLDEYPLGDDLFVMPTIPDRFGDGGTDFMGGERRQRHNRATAAPLPLTMPDRNPITALPTGLELQDTMLMDQEETFMMPELGMDMFDTHMPFEADPQLLHPEADAMVEAPQDMPEQPMHPEHPEELMIEPGAYEGQQGEGAAPGAALGSLEAVAEEQAAAEGAARQARARGRGRKRPTQLVIDDADAVQIKGTIFRAWTQDTAELIQERPQKLMRLVLATHYPGCRPTPRVTGVDMLSAGPLSAGFGQGGRWGAELEDIFASCMRPAGPGRDHHGWTADVQQVHDPEEVQLFMDHGPMAAADATAADIDMPDHTANDIFMLEEEVEVERLRAALATPGSMTDQDHAKAVQLGLTPGSSNPLERRGHKRQKRPSSAFRLDSDGRPTEDRSSPHSQRRLSDLMVGGDVGDVGVGLEGQLEDLLGPDPADMDRNPHGEPFGQRTGTAGGLTQFQLVEDSAPATQTQKAITDAITKSTLSMIGLLRDRFTDLEEQGAEEPALSLLQMTASLTRPQAAKLFYQICVTHSNNFIQAAQAEPYGDIVIHRGPFL